MPKMKVRRVGPFSLAKMQCTLMAFFGLIIGVLYGLIFMVLGGTMMSQSGLGTSGGSTIAIGLVMMIAIPIFYAVMGFIFGLIGALVYNGVAGIVGGIELELQDVPSPYTPAPAAPQQWSANPYQ